MDMRTPGKYEKMTLGPGPRSGFPKSYFLPSRSFLFHNIFIFCEHLDLQPAHTGNLHNVCVPTLLSQKRKAEEDSTIGYDVLLKEDLSSDWKQPARVPLMRQYLQVKKETDKREMPWRRLSNPRAPPL